MRFEIGDLLQYDSGNVYLIVKIIEGVTFDYFEYDDLFILSNGKNIRMDTVLSQMKTGQLKCIPRQKFSSDES